MSTLEATTTTFDVEMRYLPIMDDKMAELAKIAKRYDLEVPTYVVLETRVVTNSDGLPEEWATVQVIEQPLVIEGGWKFLALIDHTDIGNVVRSAPGIDDDLSAFQDVDGTCDHCGKVRNRTKTLVVKNEDGQVLRIGKQCAKAYLPSWKLPLTDAVSDYLWQLETLTDAWRDLSFGMGAGSPDLTTNDILEAAIRVVATFGYRSASNASPEMGLVSTKDLVEDVLSQSKSEDVIELREQVKGTSAEVVEMMKAGLVDYMGRLKAMADARDISTFENNLRVALHKGGRKNMGLITWTVESVRRDIEKMVAEQVKAEQQAERTNEWIGAIGNRITVSGTCVTSKAIETMYGVSFLVIIDTEGGQVKAFTTASNIPDLGETVTVTARVKDHEFYNGMKQTVITRPKFTIN